jgi:hypothetical protein
VTGSPFVEFADRHDLDYAERVSGAGWTLLPRGDVSEIAGGDLPGGVRGIVGRLARGTEDGREEFVLVATRIPESLGFARYISCAEANFRGPIDRGLGPGGLGLINEFQFESIEFNRRYRIVMFRTGKENRLRQLFAPTFVDWMATTAPEGLYFDLVSGMLSVTLDSATELDRACELTAHIASRIREEALEGEGLGDAPASPDAIAAVAAADAEAARIAEAAGLGGGASSVADAAERLAPIVGRRGLLGRLFRSRGDETKATVIALQLVMRSYGTRAGLEQQPIYGLEQMLPFLDNLPIGGMRMVALSGPLPGTGVTAELSAIADLAGLAGEMPIRPVVEMAAPRAPGEFVHALPRAELEGEEPTAIGGFSVVLAGGRRQTEAARRAHDAAKALARALGGQHAVIVERAEAAGSIGSATQAWLRSEPSRSLFLEGGRLVLVGEPSPALEWSHTGLDEFCASVAPVAAEAAGGEATPE